MVLDWLIAAVSILLLAHGGLTALGADMFSVAIIGPYIAYSSIICKPGHQKVTIFLASAWKIYLLHT